MNFEWTFPCYALVAPGESGLIVSAPDGNIAIFTDKHLAEQFSDEHGMNLSPLACQTANDLRNLLLSLSHEFESVIVDMNYKTRIGRFFRIETLVAKLLDQD